MDNTSSTEPRPSSLPGDPNCPICHGIGFIRQDLPVGHPDFGKMQICTCRQQALSQSVHDGLRKASNVLALQNMTFASFDSRGRLGLGDDQVQSLTYAFNQSQRFAHELNGWLLLLGGYGCGKSHLAAAIANEVISLGVPTLFLTVPDLLDWLRYSYDAPDTTFEQRFEEIRNIPLLVLDDLGTQNATSWAQEKLFQILNHRYLHRLPLVVTSNQDLAEIEGRIRSRLQDADLVTVAKINAPDYRQPISDLAQPSVSSLGLLSTRTFGSFNMRQTETLSIDEVKSLQRAYEAAQLFAEKPHGWLVLMGTYGCGKTHLAAAIGNYRKGMGIPVTFWVVPDLLDHLRAAFAPNSPTTYDHSFEEIRTTPILILDDLGTQSTTAWAREKLFQLLNYRHLAVLPTVITTSCTLEEVDPRLRSRMLDQSICQIYSILAPAFRGNQPIDKPRRTNRKSFSV